MRIFQRLLRFSARLYCICSRCVLLVEFCEMSSLPFIHLIWTVFVAALSGKCNEQIFSRMNKFVKKRHIQKSRDSNCFCYRLHLHTSNRIKHFFDGTTHLFALSGHHKSNYRSFRIKILYR